jgi:ABC-type iron transport system FetAB permease component
MDAIGSNATLDWVNVAIGLSFVIFNVAVTSYFELCIGRSLLTAALRCVLQLAVVALLLKKVFEYNNPFAVAGIAGGSGPPSR